ncbi:hypothetical protein Slin15195_G063850 [Septoria linicola]|uniref:DUF7888 domain-containing protein n=1 Tax=Septoria linicola TaxID=215465 RepID=A0A9Q9AYN8_9PEZI|nr:hypothetical protein Slin15195_G063850 [Septoria linicola]
MKFTAAAALLALAGSALAAPKEFIQPGGDHEYKPVARRSRIGPVGIAVASVAASGVLGFVGGPVANRVLNDVVGVQKKRSVHVDVSDLTFDEAPKVYLEAFVETLLKENPYDGNDAAVCSGVGYFISHPAATLDAASFKFTADGQEDEFDCFIISGPATVEVAANATESDFAFAAPDDSTWEDGVLTLLE